MKLSRHNSRQISKVYWRTKHYAGVFYSLLLKALLYVAVFAVISGAFLYLVKLGPILWSFLGQEQNNRAGLAFLALIGVVLAVWRSLVSERELRVSRENQAIDRYQKAVQMLDSDKITIRLGGIYLARDLVRSNPEISYITVLALLCQFIRSETRLMKPKIIKDHSNPDNIRTDIRVALEVFSELRMTIKDSKSLETKAFWRPDLRDVVLDGLYCENPIELSNAMLNRSKFRSSVLWDPILNYAHIQDADFENAILNRPQMTATYIGSSNFKGTSLIGMKLIGGSLFKSDLSKASLVSANLNGSNLNGANFTAASLYGATICSVYLTDACLVNCNLEKVNFLESEISDSDFEGCNGLTQGQINSAWAWNDRPPRNLPHGIVAPLYNPGVTGENKMEHILDAPGFDCRTICKVPHIDALYKPT